MAGKNTGASLTELSSFFENMGMMIRSGISFTEAVTILRDESSDSGSSFHRAFVSMADSLQAGMTFSDSMKATGVFPEYALDMISTSEYTGNLEETLFHLSSYYSAETKLRDTLVSAVRYPVILLFMVIAVLIALLVLVFPTFYGVYDNLAGTLNTSSNSFMNASFGICLVMLVLMAALVSAILINVYNWNHGKRGRVISLLSRFPSFRALFESIDLYRFTTCFEMFVSAGENQDDAIVRSIAVTETPALKERLERCSEMMLSGMTFSQSAYEAGLYDTANNRMLIPAERSGMLDSVMQKISENLQDTVQSRVSRIANTAEPLLTGSLMIFIGLILISIMLPLIGIMNSIG